MLAGDDFAVAGYLPSYRVDDWTASLDERADIPVTDLIYFQATPRPDGTLPDDAVSDERLSTLRTTGDRIGCRLSVCIGGWGKSETFRPLVASPDARRSLIAEVRRLGFDSVDFDWEYPETAADWAGYVALVREANAGLSGVVSVAIPPQRETPPELFEAADRIHLMSYDHQFPQATVGKAVDDVDWAIAVGCPPSKLLLGLPFYGRNADRDAIAYSELSWPELGEATGTDLTPGGRYAFNSRATIASKVRLARLAGLGGVMVWELGQDHTDGRSLLRALGDAIDRDNSGDGERSASAD